MKDAGDNRYFVPFWAHQSDDPDVISLLVDVDDTANLEDIPEPCWRPDFSACEANYQSLSAGMFDGHAAFFFTQGTCDPSNGNIDCRETRRSWAAGKAFNAFGLHVSKTGDFLTSQPPEFVNAPEPDPLGLPIIQEIRVLK